MKHSNYKMDKEVFISKEVVLLHPFTNQVGGHNCLLKYDESNICKIIDENELSFYQNIPKELIGFVPQFNGYLEITFKKAGKNIICLSKNFDHLQDLNLNSVVSTLINTCSSCESEKSSNCECASNNRCECVSNNRLLSLSQKVVASGRHQLMIIEDVTRKYKYPCVIDLKMGTRGCDKREKRMKKVRDTSTAPNLGVKLGGFQVNHPITGRNLRMNKFEGHMLTEHEFKLVLKDFLYTGIRYRTDILPSLIKKLNKLLKSLEMIDGYRFYCCSLLLIYDGESDNQIYFSVDDCVELRMIDFAHTCYKHEFDGPDLGLLFGVKSLIKIFEEIQFQLH